MLTRHSVTIVLLIAARKDDFRRSDDLAGRDSLPAANRDAPHVEPRPPTQRSESHAPGNAVRDFTFRLARAPRSSGFQPSLPDCPDRPSRFRSEARDRFVTSRQLPEPVGSAPPPVEPPPEPAPPAKLSCDGGAPVSTPEPIEMRLEFIDDEVDATPLL